jgi:glycosyltransferase involved in cell wall biosynthesis
LAARAAGRLLPLGPACFTADVARLGRLLHQERPRLLHVNNGGFPGAISCNAAAVAGRRAGIPVVYVVNNLAYGYHGLRRLAGWPQDRLVRRSVSRFVTGSKAAAGALAGVLDLDPSEVEVIPNTIVEGRPDETPAATRQRLGLPEHGPVLLTGARLEVRKGHAHLVEAVRRLPAELREGLSVVFAGQGPERTAIERAIAGAGVGNIVRLVGNQQNMWDLYALADVVVLPSIGHEDFPIVILEAMAAGRAVVGSRVAGVPEQVVDGVTGLVVPPADPAALAGALERLLRDADRRQAMADAGRLRYLDNYTPATVVGRYRALHDRLIEQ